MRASMVQRKDYRPKHCSVWPNMRSLFCVNCQSFYLCACADLYVLGIGLRVQLFARAASIISVSGARKICACYSAAGPNKCIVGAAFNSFLLSSIYFILGSIHGNNFYFVRLRYRRYRGWPNPAARPAEVLFLCTRMLEPGNLHAWLETTHSSMSPERKSHFYDKPNMGNSICCDWLWFASERKKRNQTNKQMRMPSLSL